MTFHYHPRLIDPIQRGSKAWHQLYGARSASERTNSYDQEVIGNAHPLQMRGLKAFRFAGAGFGIRCPKLVFDSKALFRRPGLNSQGTLATKKSISPLPCGLHHRHDSGLHRIGQMLPCIDDFAEVIGQNCLTLVHA